MMADVGASVLAADAAAASAYTSFGSGMQSAHAPQQMPQQGVHEAKHTRHERAQPRGRTQQQRHAFHAVHGTSAPNQMALMASPLH